MTFIFYFFLTAFIVLCVLLSFVILIQDSKTMGLGASFGGGDSSDSLFGTSTADVIKKFTGYLAVIFLISCILLSLWTGSIGRSRMAKEMPKIEEASK